MALNYTYFMSSYSWGSIPNLRKNQKTKSISRPTQTIGIKSTSGNKPNNPQYWVAISLLSLYVQVGYKGVADPKPTLHTTV